MKKIFKKILLVLLLYAAVILIAFSYFLIKKNQIAEVLLLSINEQINGEISFEDISFHPFIQFPSVSLVLKDFSFYESSDTIHDILENPVAEFKNVYVAFDILDLLDKKITITKVIFENGSIDVLRYPDGKINISSALELKKKQIIVNKEAPKVVKTTKVKPKRIVKPIKRPLISKTIKLKLDKIKFVDAYISYNNQINGKQSSFLLHKMLASLSIMPDSIVTSMVLKAEIHKLQVSNELEFNDLEVELQSSINMNRNDSLIKVEPSKLIYKGAEFKLDGIIDLKGKGLVDFNIKGSDEEHGFLSLLLTKSGIENLTSGKFNFKGKLKGYLKEEIPELTIDFGIKDLSLKIPSGKDSITNFNLHGSFVSGNKENLSHAILKIDTLKGQLPDGYIDGVFEMKNFTEPRISYKLDLKVNIEGLENVVEQHYVDSLKGSLELHDAFNGVLYPKKGWVDEKRGNLIFKLDSVSFQIPGSLIVDYLSGSITNMNKKVQLRKIKIHSGKSDLQINGDIANLPNLIFDEGKNIIANLSIKSKLFDFSDFMALDASKRNGFAYRLRNVETKLSTSSSHNDLTEFKKTPKIRFTIQNLKLSIDSLLAPISIKKGNFVLSEKGEIFLLNFNDIDIRSGESKLQINGTYAHQAGISPQLKTILKAKKINLSKILYKGIIDSSLSILNSNISGLVKININYLKEDIKKIGRFEFRSDTLTILEGENAIQFKSLKFIAIDISYANGLGISPLASLNAKMELGSKGLKSNYFKLKDVLYKINAENGTYTITPENDSWFGVQASGKFILSPFKNPPSYSFDYSVNQFSVGSLFANFLEDSVLTGKMDFALKLNFNGDCKDSIIKSMNGKIHVKGSNLILYGLNIDDFLKDYQQNQSFNLLDIGLAVYTGPLGLMAKKGSHFARIEVTDRSKKSRIGNMVSDWKIKNDSLIAEDVAFTTKSNRIALKGKYRYTTDILDFSIGLLDMNGCGILSQRFVGLSGNPKIVGTNLFGMASSRAINQIKQSPIIKCKPFYKGSLMHPTEAKKAK